MNAKHSAASNEHYTPLPIIRDVRETMGSIDVDPATTEAVNRARIKARTFYTEIDNGLDRAWYGNVWLNPPGGLIGRRSSQAVWWDKLVSEWLSGRTQQAIYLGFSLEILAIAQGGIRWIGSFPFCVPRERIKFIQERKGKYVSGEQPSHANIIVYLPPWETKEKSVARFARTFKRYGEVRP